MADQTINPPAGYTVDPVAPDWTPPPGYVLDQPGQRYTPAPPEQSFGAALQEYGQKMNPISMAQGLMQFSDEKWRAQNEKIANDAHDAYKRGDYIGAARHSLNYLLNGIPGLGAGLEEAGNKLEAGDIAGGLADTGALGSQIALGKYAPAILENAPRIVGPTARAVGAGVKAAGPDVLIGGAKYAAGETMPEWGGYLKVRGMEQMGRGIQKGLAAGKAALQDRLTTLTEAANKTPGQILAETDGKNWAKVSTADRQAYEDVARARANTAAQAQTATTAPAATPAAQSATAAPVATPAAQPGAAAPKTPAASAVPTLDELSQTLEGKSYDDLNEAEQARVELALYRIQNPTAGAPPPETSAAPQVPTGTPTDIRKMTIMQRRELIPGLKPRTATPAATPAAQPAVPLPLEIPEAWKNVGEQAAKQAGLKPDYKVLAQNNKANQLANFLYNAHGKLKAGEGISYADALSMKNEMDFWLKAAKGAGITPPSAATVDFALRRLQQLEQSQTIRPPAGFSMGAMKNYWENPNIPAK